MQAFSDTLFEGDLSMAVTADVLVVGGGILGLSLAYHAQRRGMKVVLLERSHRAQGGSVRNFGMVWPVGQPAGELRDRAIRSRNLWLELAEPAGIWINPCGSLHVAHADDEMAVLQEFASDARQDGFSAEIVDPQEARRLCPGLKPDQLRGALHSREECVVDPPQAIAALTNYLAAMGVEIRQGLPVVAAGSGYVRTSDGTEYVGGRVLIASGVDFTTLYPSRLSSLGMRVTKLQMLRTVPQPEADRFGPHLAFGLTLLHYAAFQDCPTLPALRARLEQDYAEHLALGIHVMASRNQRNELVLGDSHVYGNDITPFDSDKIESLILEYLYARVDLGDNRIQARWHGQYAKHPEKPLVVEDLDRDVVAVLAPGGSGMTMSLGWADDLWSRWLGIA